MWPASHLWIVVACIAATSAFADGEAIGRIEIDKDRSVPRVTVDSDGQSFEFYLSFGSSGLGVFNNTTSGTRFIESQSAEGPADELATVEFKKRVAIGGRPLNTSHFGIATAPAQLKVLRTCAGVIGLNVIAQPVVKFDLTERTIALADAHVREQDTSAPEGNVLRLHYGSTGKLSTLVRVNDRNWSFDLSTSIRERKSTGVTCCTELLRSVVPQRNIESIPNVLLPTLKALLVDGQHAQSSSQEHSNSINFLRISSDPALVKMYDEIVIDRNSMQAYFR